MVAQHSLVSRYDDVIHQGALARQRYLISRSLVDPPKSEVVIHLRPLVAPSVGHGVARVKTCLWSGLPTRLRVEERVPEDSLFCLQLVGDCDALYASATTISERKLVEVARKSTQAHAIESSFKLLQLRDEGRLDLKLWSTRVEELKGLDQRPAIFAHQVAR